MEREFFDTDEWMQHGADGTYGQGVSRPQWPYGIVTNPLPPGVTPQPNTGAPPPTTTGGRNPNAGPDGSTEPNMDPPGVMGGYWMNGQWVGGSPRTGGDTPGDPNSFASEGDLGDGTEPPFNWTQFNPTRYKSAFGPYVGATREEAENDPGYQFARDQGRKTLESSAAGRGVLRTGGTLKDILEYGNKFGDQNYQAVDNRKFRNWGANIDNEVRAYDTNYRGEKDSFDALHDSERLQFGDLYSRWKARLDSLTQIATRPD